MKKGIIFFVLIMSVLLFASGCMYSKVTKDILNYVNNQLPPLAELEDVSVRAWESVSGDNYIDDETMYDTLEKTILPQYSDFVTKLKAITVETPELQEVHNLYIKGATSQLEAFQTVKKAIEEENDSLIDVANEKLTSGYELIMQMQDKLQKLADDNNVELGENQ